MENCSMRTAQLKEEVLKKVVQGDEKHTIH